MFRYIVHIIFSLIFVSQMTGLSQDPPDGDTADSGYFTIMFEWPAITGSGHWFEPVPGDSYNVNYDNNSVTTDSFMDNIAAGVNIVSIPKHIFDNDQILDTSLFSMTIKKTDRECILTARDIAVSRKGDTLIFTEIKVCPVRVFYCEDRFCERERQQITPTVSDSIAYITYSSPNGLEIDNMTGIISTGNQSPGLYTVRYSSDYCLENDGDTIIIDPKPSFTIEKNRKICENNSIELAPENYSNDTYTWSNGISERSIVVSQPGEYILTAENVFGCRHSDTVKVRLKTIQVEQFDYEVTDADCYNSGRIDIKQLDILNGELPYIYRLENRVNRQLVHGIDNLREGDYILTIEDADGCITTAERIISIRKDCLNDYPVFSPNTDGIDDDYFIPYEGTAIVYDRNGIERARFTAPAYWDGSDNSGNPLPMGTYIIVVDKKEVINITIIK
jgi:hypothetical protein